MNIESIPLTESDKIEFKSSRLFSGAPKDGFEKLKLKLQVAASAFPNSGGGHFIVGISENDGNADGGIPSMNGRQCISDWVDTIIHSVTPTPEYTTHIITDVSSRGQLNPGNVLLIVHFPESHNAPHMAPDHHYYIRAGAHSAPATHFIVESIRSNRHFSKPYLTVIFRDKPGDEPIAQIGIISVSNSPALDVRIHINANGNLWSTKPNNAPRSPFIINCIDSLNPFYFDASPWFAIDTQLGEKVLITLEYVDIKGNCYKADFNLDPRKSISPVRLSLNQSTITKSIKDIASSLKSINDKINK